MRLWTRGVTVTAGKTARLPVACAWGGGPGLEDHDAEFGPHRAGDEGEELCSDSVMGALGLGARPAWRARGEGAARSPSGGC